MNIFRWVQGLVRLIGNTDGTTIGNKGDALKTHISGVCETSSSNSSTTPLASGATFTGVGEQNCLPQVGVMVKTDNAGTLYFDFSNDGTNWDSTYPVGGFRLSANISEFHTAVKLGRYFRVRLVNDTGAQTYLRLTTYYGLNFIPSVAPLNQSIGRDNDATLVRSTITEDEIAIGLRSGETSFTNFGYNPDIDTGVEETIWSVGGLFVPITTASTFTIAYNSGTDGAGTTGALSLYFTYIDSNGEEAFATHTLGSTGSDTTSFSGLGINRVVVLSSGSANVNTNAITITATTGGSTQASIPAGESVTQQCVYHCPTNAKAVAKTLLINVLKVSGGGGATPVVSINGIAYNRGTETQYQIFRHSIDTSVENSFEISEKVGFGISAGDILYFNATTDSNNTEVSLRFSLVQYKDN